MIYRDAIIVVGGPAGSTCAWKLKQRGVDCMVLDKHAFPRKKLCAGWITPRVVKHLELEVDNYPHSLTPFRKLHFHLCGIRFGIRTRQYAIRRDEFDNWLLERAEVSVHRHEVKRITNDGDGYAIDDQYRCKYLVGAGGTNCPVYRNIFSEGHPRNENALIVSMEEEFAHDYRDERCHLWFFENKLPGYSWYVPKRNGIVNIGIGGVASTIRKRGSTIRDHWNLFTEKLHALSLIGDRTFEPKGYTYYLRQRPSAVRDGNCYAIGDSAGLATRDMGEGIGPAIESGILAADSIAKRTDFSLKSIPTYSFPGILCFR